jgi:hypothetical protein
VLWLLIWAVLVLAALAVLALLGLRLWRAAKALVAEMGTTARRFEDVVNRLESLPGSPGGRQMPYDVR